MRIAGFLLLILVFPILGPLLYFVLRKPDMSPAGGRGRADGPGGPAPRGRPPADRRHRRLLVSRVARVVAWLAGIAIVAGLLQLLGVDIGGWLSDVWDAVTGIGLGYLVAGWTLQTAQTTLTALGWFFILRAAYPRAPVPYRQILAAYATGVALNGFLPANIGTFVMLLMFVAIVPGANFAGVLGGMLVQKIFFSLAGAFVYVYLFASVPGTFERQLKLPHDHPLLMLAALAGAAMLIVILARIFRRKLRVVVEKAKQGGAILARPREYLVRVALPSFGAWLAKLGVIAVFLAGYGIAVTFHTVMSVAGGNSIANTVSVTPGRRRRQPGHQRRRPRRRDRLRHRDRVLARPAARHHGLEHRLRARDRDLGVRLDRRQAAGGAVLRGREGQGRRGEGAARRPADSCAHHCGRPGPRRSSRRQPGRGGNMSDTLYVLAAAYDHVEDALAEYEAINVAHKHVGSTHDFDADVIAKGANGSVEIVRRHDAGKSHGAETGLTWGLAAGAVAALFPAVGILAALAVGGGAGAALGAVTGHASRRDAARGPDDAGRGPRRGRRRPGGRLRRRHGRPREREHHQGAPHRTRDHDPLGGSARGRAALTRARDRRCASHGAARRAAPVLAAAARRRDAGRRRGRRPRATGRSTSRGRRRPRSSRSSRAGSSSRASSPTSRPPARASTSSCSAGARARSGMRMTALLERKLAEGVEVRILVDEFGSKPFKQAREMYARLPRRERRSRSTASCASSPAASTTASCT